MHGIPHVAMPLIYYKMHLEVMKPNAGIYFSLPGATEVLFYCIAKKR